MLDCTLGLPVMMIATVSGCVSRHVASSSMPVTCDMCRSSSTMSNGRRFSSVCASLPRAHTLTSKPSTPSTLAQLSRSVCSSSTIRTRIELLTFSVNARDSVGFTGVRSAVLWLLPGSHRYSSGVCSNVRVYLMHHPQPAHVRAQLHFGPEQWIGRIGRGFSDEDAGVVPHCPPRAIAMPVPATCSARPHVKQTV